MATNITFHEGMHIRGLDTSEGLTVARLRQRSRAVRVAQTKRSYDLANWPEWERKGGWQPHHRVFSDLHS